MSDLDSITLPRVGSLRMGETIIEKDCTGDGLPIFSADKSNRPWAYSTHFKRLNKRGTIVIGARGTIGFPRLPRDEEFGATQTTITLTPDPDLFHSEFVCFALQQLDFSLLGAQQAIPMLTVGNLESVRIPKFPKLEQTKIAEILSTVDRVIEQAESLIAKQQRIKTGLMQDLLTRGIDEHGNLRSERTHKFKDSPLGRIPLEWDVKELRSYLTYLSYGFTNPMPEAIDGPYLITAANVIDGRIQYDACRRTATEAYSKLLTNKSRPRIGDILITKDGTLGRMAIVDRTPLCINQSVAVMRVKEGFDNEFLRLLLESDAYQRRILEDAGGSTIKHIYISKIDKMVIAVPRNVGEQIQIKELVLAQAKILSELTGQSFKFRALKVALMQDLLTGRKRVSPLFSSDE